MNPQMEPQLERKSRIYFFTGNNGEELLYVRDGVWEGFIGRLDKNNNFTSICKVSLHRQSFLNHILEYRYLLRDVIDLDKYMQFIMKKEGVSL